MRTPAEVKALARVTDLTLARFPALDPTTVRETVAEAYAEFDQAVVRDFVPVLVESVVRERLERATAVGTQPSLV